MGSDEALKLLRAQRPEVYDLMGRMARIQIAKGHDYSGADRDTFHNLRASEDLGIPTWKGVLVRLGDKWRRLCNFARQETLKVEDESIEDTLLDAANYCLFAIIMLREAHEADGVADWQRALEEDESPLANEEPPTLMPYLVCEHCLKGTKRAFDYVVSSGKFRCRWCKQLSRRYECEAVPVEVKHE